MLSSVARSAVIAPATGSGSIAANTSWIERRSSRRMTVWMVDHG